MMMMVMMGGEKSFFHMDRQAEPITPAFHTGGEHFLEKFF